MYIHSCMSRRAVGGGAVKHGAGYQLLWHQTHRSPVQTFLCFFTAPCLSNLYHVLLSRPCCSHAIVALLSVYPLPLFPVPLLTVCFLLLLVVDEYLTLLFCLRSPSPLVPRADNRRAGLERSRSRHNANPMVRWSLARWGCSPKTQEWGHESLNEAGAELVPIIHKHTPQNQRLQLHRTATSTLPYIYTYIYILSSKPVSLWKSFSFEIALKCIMIFFLWLRLCWYYFHLYIL